MIVLSTQLKVEPKETGSTWRQSPITQLENQIYIRFICLRLDHYLS